MDEATFRTIVIAWAVLGLVLFPIQLKIVAPYGRHVRPGLGPQIGNRLGWVVMELVSPVLFAALFLAGGNVKTSPMWVFFALWLAHYIHRSLIYPLRTHTGHKRIPLLIVLAAASFNAVNGGLNGAYLGWMGASYPPEWLQDPRFVVGLATFVAGASLNIWTDNRLIGLRASGNGDYQVPKGGMFAYVSCPNHLGEIIEWCGFAVLCWNLPALSFAIWTAANLLPRSLSHHRWYKRHFPDYPRERKAVIPFLV